MPSQNRRARGRRSTASSHFRPLRIELLEDRRLLAAAITVNSMADTNIRDAFFTLREAILVNNRTLSVASLSVQEQVQVVGSPTASDTDTIGFNIPGAGPHTISPTSALPNISDPVVIDGYTQSGAAANSNTSFQSLNTSLQIELAGDLTPGSTGLRLAAGSGGSTIRGLAINRFSNNVWLDTHGNTIAGNFIGTNITGTVAMPGGANGVLLIGAANNTIGGTSPADSNLISGNGSNGITIVVAGADDNFIQGNYIGTDIGGTLDIGNGIFGVFTAGALRTVIGGDGAGEGNVISGNNDHGIYFDDESHDGIVQGNRIGTDRTGTLPLGNGGSGIQVLDSSRVHVGGIVAGAGNILADNAGNGVTLVGGIESLVLGNWIGTNASGADLGNGANGVLMVNSSRNQIGGDPGGNTIAYNVADGVHVAKSGFFTANRNLIQANSIYSNGELGIELSLPDGPNFPHQFTLGANDDQNFPAITSVIESGGTTTVKGTLSFLSGTYRIELFASASVDASGFGEGQTYLGSVVVSTFNGEVATFTATLPALPPGQIFVTATATDIDDFNGSPTNNTSEFSPAFVSPTVYVVTTTADSGAGSLRQAILDANAHAGYDRIDFNFAANDARHFYYQDDGIAGQVSLTNVTTTTAADDSLIGDIDLDWTRSWFSIAPLSAFPDIADPVQIDGYSQAGAIENSNPVDNGLNSILRVEISGANAGSVATGMLRSFRTGNVLIRGLAMNRVQGTTISLNQASGSRVEGSYIGTDVSGSLTFGTPSSVGIAGQSVSQVVIGGTTPAARNLISGNTTGVTVSSIVADNRLEGNLIGTDRSGTRALGNGFGVNFGRNSIVGGPDPNARNVISANGTGVAVFIESIIQNNYIGTDVTGTMNVGNTGNGVSLGINTRDNHILSNVIAHNGGAGVSIDSGNIVGFGNLVSQNAIHSNGGPGIDLDDNGNTPNDVPPASDPPDQDNGPNGMQNFPMLTSVTDFGPGTRIEGTMLSTPNSNFRLEFYANSERDETTFSNSPDVGFGEFGEGETYLGTLDVTIDGNGVFDFSIDLPVDLLALPGIAGQPYVTATATDITLDGGAPRNNSSEFSPVYPLGGPSTVVTNTREQGVGSIREAIINSMLLPGLQTITFNIPANDPRHFYYMDDGVAGQVSHMHIAATTEANDANIVGIDPDWTHSWFSIQATRSLPEINEQFAIDGYSQPGSSKNTHAAPQGLNSILKIEFDGNGFEGPAFDVRIGAEVSHIQGLVINRFDGDGIRFDSFGGNLVSGNYIGTDASGTVDLGNSGAGIALNGEFYNRIGGTTPDHRNLVSGNEGGGITLSRSGGNVVEGNLIGVTRSSSSMLPNSGPAVLIDDSFLEAIGGTASGAGNVLAANAADAIAIVTATNPDTPIPPDDIEDLASIKAALENLRQKREDFFSTRDLYDYDPLFDATFAFVLPYLNAGFGAQIRANTSLGNVSIVAGGSLDLGFDIRDDGVTANDVGDGDDGPNGLQNFPVLTDAETTGVSTAISGTLNSRAESTYRIEFFSNDVGASYRGGHRYQGFVDVSTDVSGNATFNFNTSEPVSAGQFITATATRVIDLDDDPQTSRVPWETSEFSAGIAVTQGVPVTGDYNNDGFVNAADYVVWRDTLGSTTNLAANGDDANSVIDEDDYDVWVDNFGAPLGTGAIASVAKATESQYDTAFATFGFSSNEKQSVSRRARSAAMAELAAPSQGDTLLLLGLARRGSSYRDEPPSPSALDSLFGDSDFDYCAVESIGHDRHFRLALGDVFFLGVQQLLFNARRVSS